MFLAPQTVLRAISDLYLLVKSEQTGAEQIISRHRVKKISRAGSLIPTPQPALESIPTALDAGIAGNVIPLHDPVSARTRARLALTGPKVPPPVPVRVLAASGLKNFGKGIRI